MRWSLLHRRQYTAAAFERQCLDAALHPLFYFRLVAHACTVGWLLMSALFPVPAAGATNENRATREIRREDNAILVHDYIRVCPAFALRNRHVNAIIGKLRAGERNIVQHVNDLVKFESLIVESHHAAIISNQLQLSIISKVVFEGTNRLAKLAWLPYWGGFNVGFPSGSASEMRLHIYKDASSAESVGEFWFG